MNAGLPDFKSAMELIREGHFDQAHQIVQVGRDELSCWIHAWLHHQEGDHGNARYWYDLADKPFPTDGLEHELARITNMIEGR